MEWLLLVVLVPAIVVPVVMLWGFVGCHLFFRAEPGAAAPPQNVVAMPLSVSEISLSWVSTAVVDVAFEIHRARDGDAFEFLASVSGPPFVDPPNFGTPTPLEPGVTYNYQVFAIEGGIKSPGSEVVRARPLAFLFDLSIPNGTNQGVSGDCIVQRISGDLLRNWGAIVRIHVRGATDGNVTINGIYISRVARSSIVNPNPDAYDSDDDITLIASGVFVPANQSVPLNLPNPYTIPDPPVDLLIAFDISSMGGPNRVRHAQLTGATAFTRNATQQASIQDRFPNSTDPTVTYNTLQNRLYLVEKIEVL